MKIKGKVHKYGDDIDTDVIIPARYLTSTDPKELGKHCLEGIDPEFPRKVQPGDILVVGKNFGSGSSREHAPLAIKGAGISLVIAKSFARIFYRNAFNVGLPLLESQEAVEGTDAGDELEVELEQGKIVNLTKAKEWKAERIPEFMIELIKEGGLIPYLKKQGAGK